MSFIAGGHIYDQIKTESQASYDTLVTQLVDAHFHLHLTALYFITRNSDISNDLSPNWETLFHAKMPQADAAPTPILPSLPLLLLFNPYMNGCP